MEWPDLNISEESGLERIDVRIWFENDLDDFSDNCIIFSMSFKFKNDKILYPVSMNSFKSYFIGPTIIKHWPIGIPIKKATTTISLETWTTKEGNYYYSIELNKVKENKLVEKLAGWKDALDLDKLKEYGEIHFTLNYPAK